MVLARPQVAELLEAHLRELPGIGVVRANPVTGRLLVFHDTALSSEEVGQVIWEGVALLAAQQATALIRSSKPKRAGSAWARRQVFIFAGGAVLAVALTLLELLSRSFLPGLGPAPARTTAELRYALQQSFRAQRLLSSPILLSSPFLFLLLASPLAHHGLSKIIRWR
ncbi:MAG: hypothetical protein ACRDSH_20745 [Pseudonocardiaceae bacterium]